MKAVRRNYFTLIEILLVMALLAITLPAIAISASRMISQEKFLSSIKRVVDRLQTVQDLMVLENADSTVSFTKQDFHWLLTAKTDDFLSTAIKKQLQTPILLQNIGEISCSTSEGPSQEMPAITFVGLGHAITPCILRFTSEDKRHERYITLPGFPRPIRSAAIYESFEGTNKAEESQELYPNAIQESLKAAYTLA